MSHRRIVNLSRLRGFGDCEPEDDGPLSACPECDGDRFINGDPCWFCADPKDGEPKGYFLGDMPCNARDLERLRADARAQS